MKSLKFFCFFNEIKLVRGIEPSKKVMNWKTIYCRRKLISQVREYCKISSKETFFHESISLDLSKD